MKNQKLIVCLSTLLMVSCNQSPTPTNPHTELTEPYTATPQPITQTSQPEPSITTTLSPTETIPASPNSMSPYMISYTSSNFSGDTIQEESYLIYTDGIGQELLLDGGAFITWAPDASKYAYSKYDGAMRMFVINLGTGEELEIGEGFVTDWTPDSSRIVFMGGVSFNSFNILLN